MSSKSSGNNGGRFYSFGNKPVLIDCNFIVDSANGNGLGIRSLKGQGVQNVFMYTSATPGKSPGGVTNPLTQTASKGYAWIQLAANYNRYLGGFVGTVAPTSGSPIRINSGTAGLTVGIPYIVVSPGVGPAGVATIQPVADSSGSLASKYFMLCDSYGNSFCIWFSVSGVGSPPLLGPAAPYGSPGLQYVQQSISTNASASAIGTALATTISNLPSGITGTNAFTATGTTTVTVTSTATRPLGGIPQDGSTVIPSQGPAVPITFTITSGSATAGSVWTDGLGHLYTVTTTVASGTTLQTTGIGVPGNNGVGTLTFVSGTGSTTALTFSSAVANLATAFTFALTTSDTNLQDWQGVGLPTGFTPTTGQAFIATATGSGGSTGTAIAAGTSGIVQVEVIGDPNTTLAPKPQGSGVYTTSYVGGWILVQFLSTTSSGVATITNIAPANGSVVGMSFYVDENFSPSNIGL